MNYYKIQTLLLQYTVSEMLQNLSCLWWGCVWKIPNDGTVTSNRGSQPNSDHDLARVWSSQRLLGIQGAGQAWRAERDVAQPGERGQVGGQAKWEVVNLSGLQSFT